MPVAVVEAHHGNLPNLTGGDSTPPAIRLSRTFALQITGKQLTRLEELAKGYVDATGHKLSGDDLANLLQDVILDYIRNDPPPLTGAL